jgi:hypothetical protein
MITMRMRMNKSRMRMNKNGMRMNKNRTRMVNIYMVNVTNLWESIVVYITLLLMAYACWA